MELRSIHLMACLLLVFVTLCLIHPVYPCPGLINLKPGTTISGEPFGSTRNPTSNGYAYYGIRYGTAKRFEAPTENTDFSYLRNSTRVKQGPVCPQQFPPNSDGTPSVNPVMDEDCLYLDVYVPAVAPTEKTLLPVMMWIYGGGLQIGNKNPYNASSLADDISAIVVTINYRVNVFGFLSTGDAAARGNYGLADCKLAVQWIKKYIDKFGGNHNAITVFGESGGGFLVSAMQLDPVIQSSIRAAIAFSGSVLLEYLYIRDPSKETAELATKVGCPTSPSNEVVACLKQVSVENLLAAAKANPNFLSYAFVVDHVHFNDAPRKALPSATRYAKRVPNYVTGYLREDYSNLLTIGHPEVFDPTQPLNLATIKELVASDFSPNGNAPQCPEPNYDLAQQIMDHYNMSAKDDRPSLLLKLFHLSTDSRFGSPAAKESQIYSQRQGSAANANQLFRISHDPKYNSLGHNLGAFHMYDVPNIFYPAMPLANLTINPRVVASIRDMLRQVAHNGRMDGPSFGRTGQYMELGQSGKWETGKYDVLSMIQFWDRVYDAPCPSGETY